MVSWIHRCETSVYEGLAIYSFIFYETYMFYDFLAFILWAHFNFCSWLKALKNPGVWLLFMQIFNYSGFQLQFLPLPFSKLHALNFQPVSGFFYYGIELIIFFPFWISSFSFFLCHLPVIHLPKFCWYSLCYGLLLLVPFKKHFCRISGVNWNKYVWHTHIYLMCFLDTVFVRFILVTSAKFEGHSHIAKSIISHAK